MASNLPPGCRECDIPGNRPIDDAWNAYWERRDMTDTIEVIEEALGKTMLDDEMCDLYDFYDKHPEVKTAVDRHFEAWMQEPEDF